MPNIADAQTANRMANDDANAAEATTDVAERHAAASRAHHNAAGAWDIAAHLPEAVPNGQNATDSACDASAVAGNACDRIREDADDGFQVDSVQMAETHRAMARVHGHIYRLLIG